MITTIQVTNTNPLIHLPDVMARIEELEGLTVGLNEPAFTELVQLRVLLGDLEGNGCGVQWRGHWYPRTLLRESGFGGYLPGGDYSSVGFEGVEYWYEYGQG